MLMNPLLFDASTRWLFAGTLGVLVLASVIGGLLKWRVAKGQPHGVIDNLNSRIKAWWVMVLLIGLSFIFGKTGVIILFVFMSFAALREYITLAYTRSGDHMSLVLMFYVALPMQYFLIWIEWYGLFSIFIPVHVFLILPIVSSLRGDTTRFFAGVRDVGASGFGAPGVGAPGFEVVGGTGVTVRGAGVRTASLPGISTCGNAGAVCPLSGSGNSVGVISGSVIPRSARPAVAMSRAYVGSLAREICSIAVFVLSFLRSTGTGSTPNRVTANGLATASAATIARTIGGLVLGYRTGAGLLADRGGSSFGAGPLSSCASGPRCGVTDAHFR